MPRGKHRIVHNFFSTNNKELENNKTITYKVNFIDSFRFMSSSLWSLFDNLSEGLHNDKCTNLTLTLSTY